MATRIKPVGRGPLVDTVAERIREFIVQGRYQSGDRLPSESTLVEQLEVSRPVLREAISRLEAIGLVTVSHGRGTFVANQSWLSSCVKLVSSAMAISPRELAQFAEFRSAIESYAARRAAIKANPAEIADLQNLFDEMVRRGTEDVQEGMRQDFQFHCRLVEIGGNKLMRQVMELVQEFVMAGMMRTRPPGMVDQESRDIHRAILEAIRKGSPEAAAKAVHAHMDLLVRRLTTAGVKGSKSATTGRPKKVRAITGGHDV